VVKVSEVFESLCNCQAYEWVVFGICNDVFLCYCFGNVVY
jgi:hypothetical protein